MNKKKIIRYAVFCAVFILLVIGVSIAVITIKHRIIDNEIDSTEPNARLYSTYYNSLSYREQLLYDSVVMAADGLYEFSEIVDSEYTMEEFQDILSCIRADRPDLFYISFDELVLYKRTHKTKVKMVYTATEKEIENMIFEYDAAIDKIMLGIDPSMSDFEKEVALMDALADNCNYASVSQKALESTSYGALVMGSANCEGYAYAVKELLGNAHIDSLVVYGKANNVEHVWNMVSIDDEFYHLDMTWNDSDNEEDSKLRFHGYFNLSDAKIKKDHSYDNTKGIIPKASCEEHYYKKIGCFAEREEELEEIFYTALCKAVESKREYIEVEYVNSCDNMTFKPYYTAALDRVNSEMGKEVLYDAFSVSRANANTNAVTIRIFYN